MKKAINIIVIVALLVVFATFANAEIFGSTGSITTKAVSSYISNNGFVLHDKAVQQTDFLVLLPQGFYADLWISLPWDGKENLGKEADWTLGWSGNLGKTGLMADIGISYLDYVELLTSDGDMFSSYVKISKEIPLTEKHTLTPYAKVEFSTPVNGSNPKGGIYFYLGIQYAWQTSKIISITQNAYIVYDNGTYELEKGWIGKYNIGANVQIGKGIALTIELSAFAPLTSMSDRKAEIIPAFGLIYSF